MRACAAALIVTMVLAPLGVARAGDGPHDRSTLHGLTAVFVDVQPLDAGAARAGLVDKEIAKEIDLKLHLAGIPTISSPDDDTPPKERGVLSVNLSAVPIVENAPVYGYAVFVSLLQGVVVLRDLQTVVAAPTWWVAKSGVGDATQIRAAVTEASEKFVAAYLSVNPRK